MGLRDAAELAREHVMGQPWPWSAVATNEAEVIRTLAALLEIDRAAARAEALDSMLVSVLECVREELQDLPDLQNRVSQAINAIHARMDRKNDMQSKVRT